MKPLEETLTETELKEQGAQFMALNEQQNYALFYRDGVFHAYKQEGEEYHLHATNKKPHPQRPHKRWKYLQL